MPWLCYLLHDWFYIDGNKRRTCLRCRRYECLSVWESAFSHRTERIWVREC